MYKQVCGLLLDSVGWLWTFPSAFWAAHKTAMCCGLETHLGRGWMPVEPEWGAPPSGGRQAGAGWSPHWCIRCSHHARRRWRHRIGAHCEEGERERKRWVVWDHTTLICTFEKKRRLQWMTPVECKVEKWLLWGEGSRSNSGVHVPFHRERKKSWLAEEK